jgi:hypothetical protein
MHPEVQNLIGTVERLSSRPVVVTEDPALKVMATISTARGGAPAHFLRYRPGTMAVDYLIAYQLGFLLRLFSCPIGERWEVMATPAEQEKGIVAMGMGDLPRELAGHLVDSIVTQMRTYSVGARVDAWIWKNLPDLRDEQEHSIRSQLDENVRALAPEIRGQFPKPLVDANTTMNAAFASAWGDLLGDPRFALPYRALGYADRAGKLLAILREVPAEPTSDRILIERWAETFGLVGAFHFEPHLLT